jgi:hypothetical protein
MTILKPWSSAFLDSNNPEYEILIEEDDVLEDRYVDGFCVPKDYDIDVFSLATIPDHLEKIHLDIGGIRFVTFEKDQFADQQNLFRHKLLTSKIPYQKVRLSFEYDKAYLEKNEEYYLGEEVVKSKELTRDFVTIWDGNNYVYGPIVKEVERATGKMIRYITCRAEVQLPDMFVQFSKCDNSIQLTPITQRITINPQFMTLEFLQSCKDNNITITPLDGSATMAEALSKGFVFRAEINNYIKYENNLTSLVYKTIVP